MSTQEKRNIFSRIYHRITCRQVLNLMVILGFMLNYALRVTMTMAIVQMVKPVLKTKHGATNTCGSEDLDTSLLSNGFHNVSANLTDFVNSTVSSLVDLASNISLDNSTDSGKFDWDEYKQNLIHGSFFWGYILTELPGGRLAELIGGHRVFGHSMLWASVLTAIVPIAAKTHFILLIIARVGLGFMLGASWPAIHPMTAVWIPPMDRSKFMSNMMASALGAAVTMPISGVLMDWFGWESVFYFIGFLGILWGVCWLVFIFETPAVHPRISPEERREIEEAIGNTTSKKRPTFVPWKQLLTSAPVWAIVFTHGCSVFVYYTVVNQLPTFMSKILLFDIKSNGLFSSLPYLGKYIMAVTASIVADYLRRSGKLSTTAVRKFFTAFAAFPAGILMVIQVFVGHDRVLSVVCFTFALTMNGAVTGGYLGNGLDIAPNFSGTIFGMANTLSSVGGFLSTFMVGTLTNNCQIYERWQIVFAVMATTYFLAAIIYLCFGSGVLQPWNNPDDMVANSNGDYILANTEEAVPLKKNKADIAA